MLNTANSKISEKLKNKSILLLGGAGFIGHNLALTLSNYGANVTVLDNLMVNNVVDYSYKNQDNDIRSKINHYFLTSRLNLLKKNKVNLVNGDARNSDDLRRVLELCSPFKIVHLASIASAVDARHNPGLMFDLQLVSLRNILELMRSNSFKNIEQIMLLSSSTVYGDFEEDVVNESVRPKPNGIYANTKYMAERLVRTYANQYGLGTVIIRPSALYGERCVSRRVSQMFIENALLKKPLLLEGGGDGRLDFTYINDLIDGMVRALALTNGPEQTHTFNITFGNSRTILDLANIIKDLIPNVVLEERPRAFEKPIRGTLSIKRAKELLDFTPQWPLEKGYKKYCEWYIEHFNSLEK